MIALTGKTADELWYQAAVMVNALGTVQTSRHYSGEETHTKELLHVVLSLEDPKQRIVHYRPINPAFAIAEVIWILAGGNEVEFLKFWNPRMATWSDDGRSFYGAYGFRLGSQAGNDVFVEYSDWAASLDQLRNAYSVLQNTEHSRQVVLQIWDKDRDMPYPDGRERSKDVPCNIVADLKVRDGMLHWMQTMRSNDLMWGTPYNLIQWTTLQEIVAGWLGLEVGQYTVNVSSLHVYEQHWEELAKIIEAAEEPKEPENKADLSVLRYEDWLPMFHELVSTACDLTAYTNSNTLWSVAEEAAAVLPEAYMEWVWLLAAEALRRRGDTTRALAAIEETSLFYRDSWMRWFENQHKNTAYWVAL